MIFDTAVVMKRSVFSKLLSDIPILSERLIKYRIQIKSYNSNVLIYFDNNIYFNMHYFREAFHRVPAKDYLLIENNKFVTNGQRIVAGELEDHPWRDCIYKKDAKPIGNDVLLEAFQ